MVSLARGVERVAYHAQQASMFFPALAAQRLLRVAARVPAPPIPDDAQRAVRRRYLDLLARDLANVDAGMYPRELLFQVPVRRYAQAFPWLVLDVPRGILRKKRRDFRDIPDVDRERFPAYFRRTFHWQTDGYFSERSARLYDVGVELLFLGMADVMRRQVIPPVTRFLREQRLSTARLLDVACGTGRTLRQLATAHPGLRYWGVDMSPAYVQHARALLADLPEVTLAAENAESLPFRDASFDVVTSVYLFHELPRRSRRNVVAEMARVVRPGGLVVIEDSAQLAESPKLAPLLGAFAKDFHEPFYDEYLGDDLAEVLRDAGLVVESVEPTFVAKVVTARRP